MYEIWTQRNGTESFRSVYVCYRPGHGKGEVNKRSKSRGMTHLESEKVVYEIKGPSERYQVLHKSVYNL